MQNFSRRFTQMEYTQIFADRLCEDLRGPDQRKSAGSTFPH